MIHPPKAEEASDVNVSDENTDDQGTSAENKFGGGFNVHL